jgi:hypothetical protein
MKTSVVFVSILVGATSLAVADPSPPRDTPNPPKQEAVTPKPDEASGRVSYVEPKKGSDAKKTEAPRATGEWVEVASPTPASHANEFITVGEAAGSFSQLFITPAKGTTIVRRVRVYFTDGSDKRYVVDTAINKKGRKAAIVDLKRPRRIDHIVVTTESGKGEYAVYGASGSTGGVVSSR